MKWTQGMMAGGWGMLLLGVVGLAACGGGGSAGTPDASPVARADNYTMAAGTNQLQILAPGILANDIIESPRTILAI